MTRLVGEREALPDERVRPGLARGVPKDYRLGTHRAVAPDETLARVERFLRPMGITRVADVTGLDVIGIPVVMAIRPNSRAVSVAQGKGADLPAAKASAIMETIEGYHAERVSLPMVMGCWAELRWTHRIVAVDRMPRAQRSRFTEHTRLLWVEGRNLLDDEFRWVPYESIHTDFRFPLPEGSGCFPASSNGLASGNHPLEAVSHAICEVVERDAKTMWILAGGPAHTRIDLTTIDDPSCRDLLDRFEAAGVDVAVWDVTSDVGIPVLYASIVDRTRDPFRPLFPAGGAGCHPSRDIALSRALTEAAQGRLTYIAGSRDDCTRFDYELFQSAGFDAIGRGTMSGAPLRDFCDLPTFSSATFDDDVEWELARLAAVGIDEVVAVDLTLPAFGVPVVRVVIPGLEGMFEDMPGISLGERARRTLEARV